LAKEFARDADARGALARFAQKSCMTRDDLLFWLSVVCFLALCIVFVWALFAL
jgi:hypothetical protein